MTAAPRALTVREVAACVGGQLLAGGPETVVRGAAIDSRTISSGMLFVAMGGTRTDGHRFAGEAFRRGAAAALVAFLPPDVPAGAALVQVPDTLRAFQRLAREVRDRQRLRVVGITGSVGKTSTKEMAAAVAARAFRTARSPETWNTEIGVPLVLTNIPEDREVAVLELAMRGPGQIRDLVEICGPEIGVVTNVGESHLDFFPSREALAAAKGELLEGLPPAGAAIVNADDPLVAALATRTRARILSFGLERGDVRAAEIRARSGRGCTFVLRLPAGEAEVRLSLPGRHSVLNALAAAGVGAALGLGAKAIADGLADARPLAMRLELLRAAGITILNDVYNSSPQSVAAALQVMDEIEGAPRVAVLGDMKELGTGSAEAHRRVGREVAGRRLDLVIAFGPLAAHVAEGARDAGGVRVMHSEDPDEVLAILRRELAPGSVILLKGSRAMAMERITAALAQGTPADAAGKEKAAWRL